MSYGRAFSLVSTGTWLAASNSFWFFGVVREDDINSYEISPEDISITPIKTTNDYSSKEISEPSQGFWVTPSDKSKKYFLAPYFKKLDDFSLDFPASKTDYKSFGIDRINIKLFTNPAWKKDHGFDEYETSVEKTQIQELFKGIDEVKTKQLLLSLSIKRFWTLWTGTDHYYSNPDIFKPKSLKDLNDLKIKYFKSFEELKKYVHAKVTSCKEDKKACFAKAKELNIMDQDKISFFDKPKK